jgi:hypothetical protein
MSSGKRTRAQRDAAFTGSSALTFEAARKVSIGKFPRFEAPFPIQYRPFFEADKEQLRRRNPNNWANACVISRVIDVR